MSSPALPAGSEPRDLAPQVVRARVDTLELRVELWREQLARLGVVLPAFVVRDFGLLLAVPNEQLELDRGARDTRPNPTLEAYRELVLEFSECSICLESRALAPSDAMVVALLARLLSRIAQKCAPLKHDPDAFGLAMLEQAALARFFLLTQADSLDVDTLRLVGLLGGRAGGGTLDVVDLLAALDSPESSAVVQFSLQILPSVLEARRRVAASTQAAFGYAGLTRRGSIDSLVPSELVWDEPELTRRLLENEVLYYSREQAHTETRRHHHLLIDASASMRGERATFARAMALATAKKLLLSGDDVSLRFFDSRLYDSHPCRSGSIPTAHLLSFKSERGRHPARVFHEFTSELEVLGRRDARQQFVHVFTHAALYIPRAQVERLGRLAPLSCVFTLPSRGRLELDYLDLLHRYWVVDEAALAGGRARSEAAERILTDSTGAGRSHHAALREEPA